jgi:TPR repeat protein
VAAPAQIGRFAVLRQLGAGAMGAVFLARHPGLDQLVAIKVLHDRDPEVVARFRREAEIMARIKDSRVVDVFEAGVHEGQLYLVMEYVEGRDLAEVLKERGSLPPAEAAGLVAEVARGVAAAHRAGVIHRDLKPANVLLDAALRPKVTDFGISSRAGKGRAHSLTETGVLLGTPAYMAPEQAMDARQVDARSDVYALGVILHECLSGQRAFKGASGLAVLAAVMEGDAAPLPSGLPEPLVEVVRVAMALEPDDRYSSAEILAEALEEAFSSPEAAPSRGGAVAVGVAAVLALGVMAGVALRPGSGPPTPAAATPGKSLPSETPPAATPVMTPVASAPAPSVSPAGFPESRTPAYFEAKVRFWKADLQTLRAEAERGHPAAFTRLARLALEGVSDWPPRKEAYEFLRRGAEAGDAEAAAIYGERLAALNDPAGPIWLEKAMEWGSPWALERHRSLEAAFEAAEASAKLGDPVAHGFLVEKALSSGDRALALERLEAATGYGIAQAHAKRAVLRRDTPSPDYKGSLEDFRVAVAAGLAEGLCGLARVYAQGLGDEEQNRALALSYVKRAEAAGYPWAKVERLFCTRTAAEREAVLLQLKDVPHRGDLVAQIGLYLLGHAKTPQQRRQVGKYLYESQPLLSLDARVPRVLGIMMASGFTLGDPGAPTRAQLFARATELGDIPGLYAYGDLLLLGAGGAELDVARGLALVERAAAAGLPQASNRLGEVYSGRVLTGVERDFGKAATYFRRAGDQGQPRARVFAAELLLGSENQEERTLGREVAIKAAAELRAKQGLPPAELSYGAVTHYLGEYAFGGGRGPAVAHWATLSRNEGHPAGFSLSGRLGRGMFPAPWGEVLAAYQRAAEGGDPEGICGLARCLIEGREVEVDMKRARALLDSIRTERPLWVALEDLRAAASEQKWEPWLSSLAKIKEVGAERLQPYQWGELALHALDLRSVLPEEHQARLNPQIPTFLLRARPSKSLNCRVIFFAARFVSRRKLAVQGPMGPAEQATTLYRRAASMGHPNAIFRFAQRLLTGVGTKKNVPGALELLESAGKQEVFEAWVTLGDLSREGVGVSKDAKEAERYYRQAAEAGLPVGCAKLGAALLERGELREGVEWVTKAKDLGDPHAEVLYAECLLWGEGVSADPKAALRILEKHVESPYALEVLSRAYTEGRGVEQDPARAKGYATRSKDLFRKLEESKRP